MRMRGILVWGFFAGSQNKAVNPVSVPYERTLNTIKILILRRRGHSVTTCNSSGLHKSAAWQLNIPCFQRGDSLGFWKLDHKQPMAINFHWDCTNLGELRRKKIQAKSKTQGGNSN